MSDKPVPPAVGTLPYGIRFHFPRRFLASEIQTVGERLGELKAMKLKPDDVLVCSYPKSGTHWVGNLVSRLLHGPRSTKFAQVSPLENARGTGLSHPSPRVIYSHLRPQWLPQEHLKSGGKVFLVLRNPKDALVSFYNHLTGVGFLPPSTTWDSFFQIFIKGEMVYGRFDDYVLEWEEAIKIDKDLNILVVFYEDLMTDGFLTLQKLQNHLETNYSDESLQEMLEECSFANLKQVADKFTKEELIPGLIGDDGKCLLFRKGQIGDWKNWFTVAQNEAFDELMQERLGHCSMVEKLELTTM